MVVKDSVLYGFCSQCGNSLSKSDKKKYQVICGKCGKGLTPQEFKERARQKIADLSINEEVGELNNYIENLQENDKIKDKEKIILLMEKKYRFYADASNPNLPLYYYDGQKWNPNVEILIMKEMTNFFGKIKLKVRKEELLDYFKGDGQNTDIEPKPPHLIPFQNGLYDLNIKKLIDHTSNYFYINMIPYDYNKKSKCKNWLKFQEEIHHDYDLKFMQEWFGYGLYTGYPVKSFVICVGSGNNGKTIELDIIKMIFGHKNNTSVTLQHINDNTYGIAELQFKLTNISDDISNTVIKSTGNLKVVSDGGEITARRIYGSPFDFTPYAKITNSCNEPPIIYDDTPAIWVRLKSIDYPFQFVQDPINDGEKQAKEREKLTKSLEKEVQGIINWLLEGLIRLRNNKFIFNYPLTPEQVRINYISRSNPVVAWMDDQLIHTGNEEEDIIMKQDIYKPFVNWANDLEIKTIPPMNKFFAKLKHSGVDEYRASKGDRRAKYLGYKLKNTEYVEGETKIENF